MGSKKPTFSSLAKIELHQTPYFISLFYFLIYFYYFIFIYLFFSQLPKYLPFHFPPLSPSVPIVYSPLSPLPLSFTFSSISLYSHSPRATPIYGPCAGWVSSTSLALSLASLEATTIWVFFFNGFVIGLGSVPVDDPLQAAGEVGKRRG